MHAVADAVRFAAPEDEENLVSMVRRMHEDPDWGLRDWSGQPFPFDLEKTRARIQQATVRNRNMPNAGQAWIGVAGERGKLLGSVYLCVVDASVSDGNFLGEVWNWVVPEQRRSNIGHMLLTFALALADECKLTYYSATAHAHAGKTRFYQRHIGQPIGSLYQYNSAVGTA